MKVGKYTFRWRTLVAVIIIAPFWIPTLLLWLLLTVIVKMGDGADWLLHNIDAIPVVKWCRAIEKFLGDSK